MTTLTFLSLFLGLTAGVQPVSVDVDGPVARVEVVLDDTVCGARERPPWRFRCDFGEELAPHRLEVRGYDAEGGEIAVARQLVNLAPRQSAVEMTIGRDAEGAPRTLRLSWQSLTRDPPTEIEVRLDGETLAELPARPEPGVSATEIPLPDPLDPRELHVASAVVTFQDGSTARAEASFGAVYGDAVASQNTAIPLLPDRAHALRRASDAAGALVRRDSGEPLRPVALEGGEVDLVAVVDGSALPELAGLRESFSNLHGRGGRTGLARGDRFFLVDPVPRQVAAPARHGSGPGYDVFATSPPRGVADGGLAWQLTHVSFQPGTPQHLADAVAMAAMQAAAGGRPRAVLLVLGPEARDDSRHSAAGVRAFLHRLRVPLVVWWVERSPLLLPPHERRTALEARDERRRRQIAFAAAWEGVEEVEDFRDLLDASERLRDAVGRQRILWVEGVHLPTEVAAVEDTGSLRLLAPDDARGAGRRTASDLAARLPEVIPDAQAAGSVTAGTGAAGDGEDDEHLPEEAPPLGGSRDAGTAPPSSVRRAGAAGPVLVSGAEAATFHDSLRVDLVEVEAVVTDRRGRPVTDLGRDDFEVLEEGRTVEIRHFVAPSPPAPETDPAAPGDPPASQDRPPSAPPPLHLSIFLDEAHMAAGERNRMLERMEPLLDGLPAGARVQLVVRDAGLQVRQPFTADPAEVLAALGDAARRSGGATLRPTELRQALAQIAAQETVDDSLRAAELYASQRMVEVRLVLADLARLTDSLAPLPGRKAILYLGSELPMLAGREAFLAVERVWGSGEYGRTGHPALRAAEYDATVLYQELAARANAARVTFYGLDAAGLRTPRTAGPEEKERSLVVGLDAELAENVARPLQLLAQATGGFAITGRNRIEPELERLAADFSGGYVLGYLAAPPAGGDRRDDVRRLEVRVRRPGLQVRHREAYRPRDTDERMGAALLAAFRVPPAEHPFAPDLGFGPAAALEDGSLRLPVRVHVPLSELVLARQGGFYVTRLELFVAVELAEGPGSGEPQHSPVRRAEITVELPADRAAEARGFYTVTLPLRVEPGEQRVAVGVRDSNTGAEGVTVRPVRVAPPAGPLQRLLAERRQPAAAVAGAELLGRMRFGGRSLPAPASPNPFVTHPIRAARPEPLRTWDH